MTGAPIFAFAERNNAQLMEECRQLGYLPGSVVDLTYGRGAFWNAYRPDDFRAFDINPACGVTVADFTMMPLATGSADSVVFDPPYKLNGTSTGKGSAVSDARYGVAGCYTSAADRHQLMRAGAAEAIRIARRFVLIKCQDQISSGTYHPQTSMIIEHVRALGARVVDQLHVPGHRAQPPGRRQIHAARNYSTLLVFEVLR